MRRVDFDVLLELTDHKIKIPTEMMQNLMILHSYILVKVGATALTHDVFAHDIAHKVWSLYDTSFGLIIVLHCTWNFS